MKNLITAAFVLFLWGTITPAAAQYHGYGRDSHVHGYTRHDGTYVQPHHRTVPDGNPWNNYSSRGNINPWTGGKGYADPYRHDSNSLLNPYIRPRNSYSWP